MQIQQDRNVVTFKRDRNQLNFCGDCNLLFYLATKVFGAYNFFLQISDVGGLSGFPPGCGPAYKETLNFCVLRKKRRAPRRKFALVIVRVICRMSGWHRR